MAVISGVFYQGGGERCAGANESALDYSHPFPAIFYMGSRTVSVPVYLSLAPEDDGLMQAVVTHLTALEREGLITIWHGGILGPGDVSGSETKAGLASPPGQGPSTYSPDKRVAFFRSRRPWYGNFRGASATQVRHSGFLGVESTDDARSPLLTRLRRICA